MLRVSNSSSSAGNEWHVSVLDMIICKILMLFRDSTGSMIKYRGSIIKHRISLLGAGTGSPGK